VARREGREGCGLRGLRARGLAALARRARSDRPEGPDALADASSMPDDAARRTLGRAAPSTAASCPTPMIVLVPMRPAQFEEFARATIADYARDNVSALRWSEDNALERAGAEFGRLLPQGLATPGQVLCEIQHEAGGEMLGWLWYARLEAAGARWLYLYNIRVLPSHRGQGHARAALEQLQRRAAEHGADAIELHVFAVNPTAHALYRSLGYGITGYNMIKRLGPASQPVTARAS